MADQEYEYEQYAPQDGGRLFTNAMFGFNKEEVLEYLDELADENYQRQEAADMQIAELTQRIQSMETGYGAGQYATADVEAFQQQVGQLHEELEIAKAATQQSEGDLAEARDQLFNAQQENTWLREEYQKTESRISDLQRQLEAASSGQWVDDSEARIRLEEKEKQLDDQLAQLEKREMELTRREQSLTDEDSLMAEKNNRLAEQEKQLAEKERALESSERKLEELQDQRDGLKDELKAERAALDTQRVALEEKDKLAQQAKKDLEAREAELSEKLAEKEFLIADKEGKLADIAGKMTLVEKKFAEQDDKLEEKDQLLAEKEKQLADAEAGLAESTKKAEADAQKVEELRHRLDVTLAELEEEKSKSPGDAASAAIIADANAEADRIRAIALDEKERIRRQIRSSAGGLAESITNLRGDVTGVEDNVTHVLEAVQTSLSDILNALNRTEQNLNTLGVQVERFPATSAPVQRPAVQPQQVVYFQPGEEEFTEPKPQPRAGKQRQESLGRSGFRRVTADEKEGSNLRPFRPTYSSSPGATAYAVQPAEDEDERMRALAENLVDTLREMMN